MTVTKRVRMTDEEAARLAALAAASGKTESEVLREGILLVDREQRKQRAWQQLIDMAERDKDTVWQKAEGGWK